MTADLATVIERSPGVAQVRSGVSQCRVLLEIAHVYWGSSRLGKGKRMFAVDQLAEGDELESNILRIMENGSSRNRVGDFSG